MQTVSTVFERELRKLIAARIDHLTQNLASGSASSYEDYKRIVGEIAGLGWVLDDSIPEADKLTQERGGL